MALSDKIRIPSDPDADRAWAEQFEQLSGFKWRPDSTLLRSILLNRTDGEFSEDEVRRIVSSDLPAGDPLIADIGPASFSRRLCAGLARFNEKHGLASFNQSAVAPPQRDVADKADGDDPQATAHSPDFRSVNWFGAEYSFTPSQACVVETLWIAWQQSTPDVGDETLLKAVDHESPPPSLRNLFRDHAAWRTMIVAGGSKGAHRLAEPVKSETPAKYIA